MAYADTSGIWKILMMARVRLDEKLAACLPPGHFLLPGVKADDLLLNAVSAAATAYSTAAPAAPNRFSYGDRFNGTRCACHAACADLPCSSPAAGLLYAPASQHTGSIPRQLVQEGSRRPGGSAPRLQSHGGPLRAAAGGPGGAGGKVPRRRRPRAHQ